MTREITRGRRHWLPRPLPWNLKTLKWLRFASASGITASEPIVSRYFCVILTRLRTHASLYSRLHFYRDRQGRNRVCQSLSFSGIRRSIGRSLANSSARLPDIWDIARLDIRGIVGRMDLSLSDFDSMFGTRPALSSSRWDFNGVCGSRLEIAQLDPVT